MVFLKYLVLVIFVVIFIVVYNLYKKWRKKYDVDLFIFKNNENKMKYI